MNPAPGPYATPPGGGAYAPAVPAYGLGEAQVQMPIDPSRKLQPGDQLSLQIQEDREAAVAVSVGQSGDVIVDPVPHGIKVSGLTIPQASNEIKRELEKDYYYTASVRLVLERASSNPAGTITLSGKVARVGPLPFFSERPLTCSGAIMQAGGFALYANERRVQVTRRNKDGSTQRIMVDVKAVLNEGKVDKDIQLQDGDSIFVDGVFIRLN